MNKYIKWGLVLQIPNFILLSIFAIAFIIPLLTSTIIFWAIFGSIYALINIFSFILIVVGLFAKQEKER